MKLPHIPRRLRTPALCLICAAAIFAAVHLPVFVAAGATPRQLPIYCVRRDQKMVSLSFDAAWGDAKVRQRRAPCRSHGNSSCFSSKALSASENR